MTRWWCWIDGVLTKASERCRVSVGSMISAVVPYVPFHDRNRVCGVAICKNTLKTSEVKCDETGFLSGRNQSEWKERVGVGYRFYQQRWIACCFGDKVYELKVRMKKEDEDGVLFVMDVMKRVDEMGKRCSKNNQSEREGPELIQILADYFGYLKNVVLAECLKKYARDGFDVSLVQWSISIPISWGHEQKQLIRLAAFEAGIIDLPSADTLVLCTDTDAVLLGLKWTGELEAQIGNIVTVCDCGASKTKISTVKILPGNSFMPIGKPTVLDIGSESIDKELYARFQAHVGMDLFEEWIQESPQLLVRIDAQFKVLKQFFNSRKKSSESCKKIKIHNNEVVLFTNSEAMEVMTMVVDQIAEGVKHHLNCLYTSMNQSNIASSMKMVVVGGHARSHTLAKKLASLVGTPDHFILAQQPSKSILYGLTYLSIMPNAIRERSSRFSYGTQFSKLFDPKTDDPTAYRWGSPPNQFIASFLPFTKAGTPTPPEKVFEQIVCPANDHQTEFPFGLYFSMLPNPKLKECIELVTLTVAIPEGYRHLGRENRFRILMEFGVTEIKFSVVHTQSGEVHESVVVL